MAKYLLLTISFIAFHLNLSAQDYTWWNAKHNWDGHSYWREYLIFASNYFGPNALPVPQMRTSTISQNIELEIANDYFYGFGDKTQDISARLQLPLLPGRVALEFWDVAYEQFQTTPQVRDKRFARDQSGKGHATGDVYIATLIQLVRNTYFPDILISMNLRTASGTNLNNARYTDSPGYYFDLTAGKSLHLINNELRLSAVAGFYVWQRYYKDNWQDDAYLYGLAISNTYAKHYTIETQLAGYTGYSQGDKPIVWRVSGAYNFNKLSCFTQFERGLHNFPFNHIKIGLIYRPCTLFSKEKLLNLIERDAN